MMGRHLLVAGVVAPLVYLTAVVLGGLLRPGYSHLAHAISELTEAHSGVVSANCDGRLRHRRSSGLSWWTEGIDD